MQDIQLRLTSLPPPRGATSTRLCFSSTPGAPEHVLSQLASVRNLVNQSLDVVDVSTWTGDPLNANFISGQLRLLYENISEARTTLKGDADTSKWWETSADDDVREWHHVKIIRLLTADTGFRPSFTTICLIPSCSFRCGSSSTLTNSRAKLTNSDTNILCTRHLFVRFFASG
jgi:hypothetical protein